MDHKTPNTALYNIPLKTDNFNGMPYRYLGNSGLRVPNVGLGAWKIGYPKTGDKSRVDEKSAFRMFDRSVEIGVTLWDTANRYNNASGNSERVIGKWLNTNVHQRRNIILATKLGGGMDGTTPNHCGLSRGNIMESVYASLERLQTDYIDLLYFHSFDPVTPIDESLAAIEDLVKQDLIRYFAVSNFTIAQLKAYKVLEKEMSVRSRIVAVQNQYDILNGESQSYEGVLNYASERGMSYIAWSPMAKGLLSGRYLDPSKIGPGDRLFDEGELQENTSQSNMKKLNQLSALSSGWGMELNQLALSYMLSLPGMGPVIPSSSNLQQLESNAAAGKIVLSEEQKMRIKGIL